MSSSDNNPSGRARKSARFNGRYEGNGHICDVQGCHEDGEFRAPPAYGGASCDGPGQWRWFCLDHIRDFNTGYNFFAGMSSEEIYDAQSPHNSWASGWESERRVYANHGDPPPRWSSFADPLDAIGARFREKMHFGSQAGAGAARLGKADRLALSTLGLGEHADRKTIRKAYSELVRRYHPDRNGGNRAHEKALQDVIAAYTHLKNAAAFS